MSAELTKLIKKIAMEAFKASKPTDGIYGEVENLNPVVIRVNQRMLLNSEHLVNTIKLTQLSLNDKVVLMRMQGGQKYVVMDVIDE